MFFCPTVQLSIFELPFFSMQFTLLELLLLQRLVNEQLAAAENATVPTRKEAAVKDQGTFYKALSSISQKIENVLNEF